MKSRQFQSSEMVNNNAHACVIYSRNVDLYIIKRGLLFYYLKTGSREPHEGNITIVPTLFLCNKPPNVGNSKAQCYLYEKISGSLIGNDGLLYKV